MKVRQRTIQGTPMNECGRSSINGGHADRMHTTLTWRHTLTRTLHFTAVCVPVSYTAKASDSLASVAETHSVSVTQLMLDNYLVWNQPLVDGLRLLIMCPTGRFLLVDTIITLSQMTRSLLIFYGFDLWIYTDYPD